MPPDESRAGLSPADADPAATAQAFYTRWAGVYDAIATHTPGVEQVRTRAAAALDPEPGDTVVEMGCGTGANFPYLRDRVGEEGRVVGVDFSPGMVARARDRVAANGWENVDIVRGDAADPPVTDVDAVVASFVMGMLPDPDAAVRRWASLAGSGGRLALVDLARSTRHPAKPLNALFKGLVVAGAPAGTRRRHGRSPTAVLDERVAAAHRALFDVCEDVAHTTHVLGFVRVSAGTVA